MHQLKEPGSCPQTGYLNWFGTARVMKQGPRATAGVRMREVLKLSQGCHNCNLTAQHPVVKHPIVHLSDYDEGEVFQRGPGQQVQTPSTLQWTRSSGPQRSIAKQHIQMMALVHLAVSCCILWKLSHCWWWRLTGTTMTTLADSRRNLRPSLP